MRDGMRSIVSCASRRSSGGRIVAAVSAQFGRLRRRRRRANTVTATLKEYSAATCSDEQHTQAAPRWRGG